MYIFGRRTIADALRSGRSIEKIFIAYGVKEDSITDILRIARSEKIPVVTADKTKFKLLEEEAQAGTFSQGVIALTVNYKQVSDVELFQEALTVTPHPVIVALDGINDPHNLGAIARSIVCSNAHGLLLPTHNAAPITSAAMKTSAGALEMLSIAKTVSLSRSLERAKEVGYWIIGTDAQATHAYTANLYDRPVVLIIGNEGDGMRTSTRKLCDAVINIPINPKFDSLNASVAAGVILFEIARQKNE